MAPQIGRLHWVFNVDRRFGAAGGYWRVLVLTPTGPEIFLLTPSELESIRTRVGANPEELLFPSWLDVLWAWLCSWWPAPRGPRPLRED
jgi:hypothetical protein